MFKMIREAQAHANLGAKAGLAKQVQTILGAKSIVDVKGIFEAFDPSAFEIKPEYYAQWMEALQGEAAERGINLSDRAEFMDFAHDMLDNDPRIQELNADDKLRQKIVSTLWKAAQATRSHKDVNAAVGGHIQKAREEEEQVEKLVGANDGERDRRSHTPATRPALDTRRTAGGANNTNNANGTIDHDKWSRLPMPTRRPAAENEEAQFSSMMKQSMGMEDESHSEFKADINRPAKKNPYPANSLRHALWNDIHNAKAREEEEFDDMEGEDRPSPEEAAVKITGVEGGSEGQDAGEGDMDDDLTSSDEMSADADPESTEAELKDHESNDQEYYDKVDELMARVAELEAELQGQSGDEPTGEGEAMVGRDEMEPKVSKDEGDMDDMDMDKPAGEPEFDEEEQVKNFFRKAITSPKTMLSQAVKDVEEEGAAAWTKLQLPSNPHPRKSQAHGAWTRGLTKAAKEALGLNEKPELKARPQPAKKKPARR